MQRAQTSDSLFSGAGPAHARKAPVSWLQGATILAVYGRGFGTAPVLGMLGMAHSFDDLEQRTDPARRALQRLAPHARVRMAIHLIYGMAASCASDQDNCLAYLDDAGVDIARDYIRPAARRGWLVILDDQLGRSTPAREIGRLRRKGYLAYDNVEVAFDPEYRTVGEGMLPGSSAGQVTAEEINAAERAIEGAVARNGLAHRKLLLIHQWTPFMILNRRALSTHLKSVQPAIIMDGIGPADEKVGAYRSLISRGLVSRGVTPGIKLFFPNPYDPSGHADQPVLTWSQLAGRAAVIGSTGIQTMLRPAPRIVIMS